MFEAVIVTGNAEVLISFREWLHSYYSANKCKFDEVRSCSHLFQRVASFLPSRSFKLRSQRFPSFSSLSESGFIPTLINISKGAWNSAPWFSSLSESGFIPTENKSPLNMGE